jgi:hypothetical protein
MAPAVTPVEADFPDQHRADGAGPQRQGGRGAGDGGRENRVHGQGDQCGGRPEHESERQAVEEIPAEVDRPAFVEEPAPAHGEEVLERREERGDEHQGQAQARRLDEILQGVAVVSEERGHDSGGLLSEA